MEVKVFESFKLQDAIKLVKAELGRDAVIISTREKETYSEEFGKNCRIYEVTAAANVSENKRVIPSSIGSQLPKLEFPKVAGKNPVTVVKDNSAKRNYPNATATLSNHADLAKKSGYNQYQDNFGMDIDNIRSDILELKKEIGRLPEIDVTEQMKEIKVLLHDLMKEKFKKMSETENVHITDIGVRLRIAGVDEGLISHLCSFLIGLEEPRKNEDLLNSNEKTKEFYLSSTIKFIFKNVHVYDFLKEKNQQKIICLVGATGVGKTTTIAKIAAKIKLQQGKKVDLISMDTFRIAAADQLRIYAKILECPFSEVSDNQELLQIVSKKTDSDFILIDTAGRSGCVPEQVQILKNMMTIPMPIEFHLVLSSSVKQRDIDETIRAFRFLSPASLIFTKLDESWAFGEILNSAMQSQIPLSYFTIGQRVPEDMEIASKERVVERLLKL